MVPLLARITPPEGGTATRPARGGVDAAARASKIWRRGPQRRPQHPTGRSSNRTFPRVRPPAAITPATASPAARGLPAITATPDAVVASTANPYSAVAPPPSLPTRRPPPTVSGARDATVALPDTTIRRVPRHDPPPQRTHNSATRQTATPVPEPRRATPGHGTVSTTAGRRGGRPRRLRRGRSRAIRSR
jgi:hypothetical protein